MIGLLEITGEAFHRVYNFLYRKVTGRLSPDELQTERIGREVDEMVNRPWSIEDQFIAVTRVNVNNRSNRDEI